MGRVEVVFTEVPVFMAGAMTVTMTMSVVVVMLMAALQNMGGGRGVSSWHWRPAVDYGLLKLAAIAVWLTHLY